jgi:hypothetical protein
MCQPITSFDIEHLTGAGGAVDEGAGLDGSL